MPISFPLYPYYTWPLAGQNIYLYYTWLVANQNIFLFLLLPPTYPYLPMANSQPNIYIFTWPFSQPKYTYYSWPVYSQTIHIYTWLAAGQNILIYVLLANRQTKQLYLHLAVATGNSLLGENIVSQKYGQSKYI